MTTTTLSKEKTVPAAPLQLDLRDWFAGQALAGMNASLSSCAEWPTGNAVTTMADSAYEQADAMLAARAARTGEAA